MEFKNPESITLSCPINCGVRWKWKEKQIKELDLLTHLLMNHAHEMDSYSKALEIAESSKLLAMCPGLSIKRSFKRMIQNALPFACSQCDCAFKHFQRLNIHYNGYHKKNTISADHMKLVRKRFKNFMETNITSDLTSDGLSQASTSTANISDDLTINSSCNTNEIPSLVRKRLSKADITDMLLTNLNDLPKKEQTRLNAKIEDWLEECESFYMEHKEMEIVEDPLYLKRGYSNVWRPKNSDPAGPKARISTSAFRQFNNNKALEVIPTETLFDQLPSRRFRRLLAQSTKDSEQQDLSFLNDKT